MSAISRILLPHGIHDGVPASQYHAMPALSASGCKTILDECPAIFRHERDNSDPTDSSAVSRMGTAGHSLSLEPEKWDDTVVIIPAADFRTNAAKAARDAALEAGKVPLLEAQADVIRAMNRMLKAEVGDLFAGGRAERTYRWSDPETGVEMKARPDYVKPRQIIDFKTSGSASPADFQRRLKDCLHHVQAAIYLDAHELLTGETCEWLWIVQSTEAPYLVSAFRASAAMLHVGRVMARHAIDTYAACTASGIWPSYTPEPLTLDLPGWMMRDFEEREAAGEFRRAVRPNNPMQAVAMAAQAPIKD